MRVASLLLSSVFGLLILSAQAQTYIVNGSFERAPQKKSPPPRLYHCDFSGNAALLDSLAAALLRAPIDRLLIEGHTDNRCSRELNSKLSQARAEAVIDRLIQRGVSPERLRATGMDFERLVADNATPEGRARNRRVCIRADNP